MFWLFLIVGILFIAFLLYNVIDMIPHNVIAVLVMAGIVLIAVGAIGNWFSPRYGVGLSGYEWLIMLGGLLLLVGIAKATIDDMEKK